MIKKINCPNCGAVGVVGSVCEFCGSTIIEKKTAKGIQKKEGSQKDSNKKELKNFYSPNKITEKEAAKIFKDFIVEEINTDMKMNGDDEFQDRILKPLDKTIELLELKVYPSVWLPFFLYRGETFDGKKNEDFNILAFAGNKKQLPFNFINLITFKNCNSFELEPITKNIEFLKVHKVQKDYVKIWDESLSVREEWGGGYKSLKLPKDTIIVYLNIIPIKIKPLVKGVDDNLFGLVNANNGDVFLNIEFFYDEFQENTRYLLFNYLFYDIYKIKNLPFTVYNDSYYDNIDHLDEWRPLEEFEFWSLGLLLENKPYSNFLELNKYIKNYDDFLKVKETLIQINEDKEKYRRQYEEYLKQKEQKEKKEKNYENLKTALWLILIVIITLVICLGIPFMIVS